MKKYIICLVGIILFTSFLFSQNAGYMKNDIHQHTTFTDGKYSLSTMMYMSNKYGLDFGLIVNMEEALPEMVLGRLQP